ncbi:hypothetical protein D9613_011614 [Agrocybe pediades]|uniref:Hexosyltransferase n=1 Tax=Agrocybe pediades TaxID=84607 RepID=A0A8H4VQD9_9AGAR|nr:hypothetical protein D9613_011614 [Agrocybe pediades]
MTSVPRPGYLDLPMPSSEPLVIRLGIMCRVDGWEKRSALREAMLSGVPDAYVKLEYKFFVGTASNTTTGKLRSKGESAAVVMQKVREESEKFGDMVVLEDVEDIPERISEKRFQALRWGASVPKEEYDYFMTMDSDSFCRLRTLAQRLSLVYSNLKPRQEPILVGNMGSHDVYWENTSPPDGTKDGKFVEDVWFTGPKFPYPVGIGYMLSSDLTATILTADPPVPHHINYPYDDVMIGSWMAALKSFHNASTVFETPKRRYMPKHQLHPKPYLPYVVEARLIDDKRGRHDFWHRGLLERSVSWDTACVHRIKPTEMRRLRGMREVSGEWEDMPRRL